MKLVPALRLRSEAPDIVSAQPCWRPGSPHKSLPASWLGGLRGGNGGAHRRSHLDRHTVEDVESIVARRVGVAAGPLVQYEHLAVPDQTELVGAHHGRQWLHAHVRHTEVHIRKRWLPDTGTVPCGGTHLRSPASARTGQSKASSHRHRAMLAAHANTLR